MEDLKPKDALYETVKSNMHKAFWNKLREDLAKDPPDHAHAFVLLKDLKEVGPTVFPEFIKKKKN